MDAWVVPVALRGKKKKTRIYRILLRKNIPPFVIEEKRVKKRVMLWGVT